MSQPQRKALLRCLIDTVVVHRVASSQAQVRVVVPVQVKSLAARPRAADMEPLIRDFCAAGQSDAESATR